MSDLEAAIAAEMRLAGCSPSKVDDCREHPNDGRWSDRDACPIVAAAVRAGWDAAINAAADQLDELFHSERDRIKKPIRETDKAYYLDGITTAEEAVRALLSEGGDRE